MLFQQSFHKGINLGGWMSQCDYTQHTLDTWITEPDFAQIAAWGFDHVRIPVDYNIFQASDGSFLDAGFDCLQYAAVLCKKYHLNLILDLHKTAGFSFDEGETEEGFFDSESYQEQFYQLWEEFARRYGNDPEHIAFELLNEVTDQSYIETWNRIADTCIERIRKFAPETYILVGSFNNNGAKEIPYLDPPHDDKIIYNFHCYEPLLFTHQGATWTVRIDPAARMRFEESETSEAYFETLFAAAIQKAKENNTVLYCGEYGMIDVARADDSLKWFKVINKVFEKYGIGRSVWTYKGLDFGLTDAKYDGCRDEIIKYL